MGDQLTDCLVPLVIRWPSTGHRAQVAPFYKGTFMRCCGDYAESDIYYLEVCVVNEICSNRAQLFSLSRGQNFRCQFDAAGYKSMQQALMRWG